MKRKALVILLLALGVLVAAPPSPLPAAYPQTLTVNNPS